MKFKDQDELEHYLAEREKVEQELLARLKQLEEKIAIIEKTKNKKGLGWFAEKSE